MLAGADPNMILEKTEHMLSVERGWMSPFGAGKAGERTVRTLLNNLQMSCGG